MCIGSRQYNPHAVGLETDCVGRKFVIDTGLDGNRNARHELADAPLGRGVISRALSHYQCRDLIEHLKTL